MLQSDDGNLTSREEREDEKTDYDLCTVGRSGAARAPLSVHRWDEAGPAARGDDRANTAAGSVRAVPRRGRGARRDRPDPPRAPWHSAGPDTAGRRRAGDHHDRCDGAHAGGSCAGRWCPGGADSAGGGAALGVCRLRSLATGAASRVVSPVRAPAVQLRRVVIALRCLLYSMELTVLKWVGT